jgi:hypothetical protein
LASGDEGAALTQSKQHAGIALLSPVQEEEEEMRKTRKNNGNCILDFVF